MKSIADQHYLKSDQYRNGSNLDARIQLHRLFSTNPANYFEWMYDQLHIQPKMQVLEVGCGTGEFWRANFARLPEGLNPTMLDLSAGMAKAARETVCQDPRFSFSAADAQELPFADAQFDIVLANYMLYHVPDIPQAVRELRRVLKPGGRLCAATNGIGHMGELHDLLNQYGLPYDRIPDFTGRYGLENAPQILGCGFDHTEVIRYIDDLFITETQPLMDYIHSMSGQWNLPPENDPLVEQRVTAEIAAKGGFTIHKAGGMVLAW